MQLCEKPYEELQLATNQASEMYTLFLLYITSM